jgi:hypothetical protein
VKNSCEHVVVISGRLLEGSLYHEVSLLFVTISLRNYTKIMMWKLWGGL